MYQTHYHIEHKSPPPLQMLARMQPVMGPTTTFAGDGFFLNLSWVMLKLAAPFAKRDAPLIRSIDPLYCSASAEGGDRLDFSRETRMAPLDPGVSGCVCVVCVCVCVCTW